VDGIIVGRPSRITPKVLMADCNRSQEFQVVSALLDEHWERQGSSQFKSALFRLITLAESGSIEAAEFLAEIQAMPGPNHDAASAYKWYFIALSNQGYSTNFADTNNSPPNYCGPVGDFRNESMVSDLVIELGFDRIHKLDSDITLWLSEHMNQPFAQSESTSSHVLQDPTTKPGV
jgi:hypothetical protein